MVSWQMTNYSTTMTLTRTGRIFCLPSKRSESKEKEKKEDAKMKKGADMEKAKAKKADKPL
jgi:hypothetical protein